MRIGAINKGMKAVTACRNFDKRPQYIKKFLNQGIDDRPIIIECMIEVKAGKSIVVFWTYDNTKTGTGNVPYRFVDYR